MTYNDWQTVLWLSTAIDATALLYISTKVRLGEFFNGSGRSLATRGAVFLIIFCFFWTIKTIVIAGFGLSSLFGLIHLVYLDLVVVLPLTGLILFVLAKSVPSERKRWRTAMRLTAVPLLLAAPVGAYASYIEPFRLTLEKTTVPVDRNRAGKDTFRIAVIADLQTEHVTGYERKAVRRIMKLKPDLILIAGDIHQNTARNFPRELPALQRLFRRLSAPGGVFLVQGDTDSIPRLKQMTAGSSTKLLYNTVHPTRIGDRKVTVGGLGIRYDSSQARRVIERLESEPEDGGLRILLTHRPDPVLSLRPNTRIDLTVAGHTHGGQINPPLIDPPLVLSKVPHSVGAGGLHDIGEQRRVYISRGIGVERGIAPRMRLGAPPEIALLTLKDRVKSR